MSTEEAITIDERLVTAWQRTLPTVVNEGDQVEVIADEAEPNSLRVTIQSAGRTGYSFDFKCTYLDPREVRVELIDVEKDGINVDERTDIIQNLVEDYIRHIHECTQVLHEITKA